MTWSWLEREREHQMTELELEEMLAEFVATGLVLERKGKDARTYYSVNLRKVSEIQALLKEWGRDPARQSPPSAHSPEDKHMTWENPSRRERRHNGAARLTKC